MFHVAFAHQGEANCLNSFCRYCHTALHFCLAETWITDGTREMNGLNHRTQGVNRGSSSSFLGKDIKGCLGAKAVSVSVKLIRLLCGEAGSSPIDVYEPFAVMVSGLRPTLMCGSTSWVLGSAKGVGTQHKACCFLGLKCQERALFSHRPTSLRKNGLRDSARASFRWWF